MTSDPAARREKGESLASTMSLRALSPTEAAAAVDTILDLCAELERLTETLRLIARHEVQGVVSSDPCDWHCTRTMVEWARDALREAAA